MKVTRRQTLTSLASAGIASTMPPLAAGATTPTTGGIQFSELFTPGDMRKVKLAKQVGVNHAIVGVAGALGKVRREEYVATLRAIKDEFAQAGLAIAGVESHPVDAEKIKLGIAGRDEQIENYKAAIAALSQVGIPMVCYNFMAGLGWYRTKVDVRERGGALVSEFNLTDAEAKGPTQWGEVSEEKMWSNIEYFLKAVIPVAEKYKIQMALHPDDPPLSPIRGIARIVTSARNYRRIMDMVPSPINGVTYCQANFVLMGEDIAALAAEWCRKQKIFFVHFRDVTGTKQHFRETFHDNGPTDMVKMLQVYSQNGFAGPMRPDHAPTLDNEDNDHPGYGMNGKIFAFGYMGGIMRALKLPYC
jgi:mannonate dehydratase